MAANPMQPQNKPKVTVGVGMGGAQPQPAQPVQPQQPAQPKIQQPKPVQPKQSGSFQNIKQYQQANVPGTQKLAGNVSGNIQGQAGQAQQQIGQAQQQSQQQIQQGMTQGQQALTGAQQAVGGYAGLTPEQLEQQIQSGLGVAGQAQQLGQTGLAGAQDLYGQAAKLGELGQATGSIGGRQEILKDLIQKKYSQGQSQMDALLLGGNQQARQQLLAAKQATRGLGQQVGSAEQTVMSDAQRAEQELSQGVEGLQSKLGETGTAGEAELQAAAEAANKAAEDEAGRALSPEEKIEMLKQAGYDTADVAIQKTLGGVGTPTNQLGASVLGATKGIMGSQSKALSGKVNIPGVGMVNIEDVPSDFFKSEVTGKADTGNIDPAKLARLNVIRKLGGQAEIAGAGEQYKQNIQRGLDKQGLQGEMGRIQSELTSANVQNAKPVQGLNAGSDPNTRAIMNDVANSNDHYAKLATRLDPKGVDVAMKFTTQADRNTLAEYAKRSNPQIAEKIKNGTATADDLKLVQAHGKLKGGIGNEGQLAVLMKSLGTKAIENSRAQSAYYKKQDITGTFGKKKGK